MTHIILVAMWRTLGAWINLKSRFESRIALRFGSDNQRSVILQADLALAALVCAVLRLLPSSFVHSPSDTFKR